MCGVRRRRTFGFMFLNYREEIAREHKRAMEDVNHRAYLLQAQEPKAPPQRRLLRPPSLRRFRLRVLDL